jgi:gamma-glutamyltranspeptidase
VGDPTHPSSVAPGKRPRSRRSPALAFKNGKAFMPFGTPGGDVQPQAMLQVFLNVNVFGMDPQSAIDAPRFANYTYPGSFEPHPYYPGRLYLESRIEQATRDELSDRGTRSTMARHRRGSPARCARSSRITRTACCIGGAGRAQTGIRVGLVTVL